ncbi:MAG: hypothetical protein ABIS36_25395 [Chryseolinea sp.]
MGLNLLEETIDHFNHGASSVRAYSSEIALVITRSTNPEFQYIVTMEDSGFTKTKTNDLQPYFEDVFGIEARY